MNVSAVLSVFVSLFGKRLAAAVAAVQQQEATFSPLDWAQFGALGVLAGVMLYLYTQQAKLHRDELQQIYQRHEKALESIAARALAVSEATSAAIQELRTTITDVHRSLDTAQNLEKLRNEIREIRERN